MKQKNENKSKREINIIHRRKKKEIKQAHTRRQKRMVISDYSSSIKVWDFDREPARSTLDIDDYLTRATERVRERFGKIEKDKEKKKD